MTETILKSNSHRGDTFLIVSDYPSGRILEETDNGFSRAQAVQGICDGQFERAARVICINLDEGTIEDVSAEIAEACLDRIIAAYWPGHDPYIPEIIEEYCGPALTEWKEQVGVAA